MFPTLTRAQESKPLALIPPYSKFDVIAATNKIRTQKELDSLTYNPLLSYVAQQRANDMVAKGYFDHVTPTGIKFWEFMKHAGYNYSNAGENLAFQYPTVKKLMLAWTNSATHKHMIMNPKFTDVGIGLAYGKRNGQNGWFVVELFGSKLQDS